MPQRVASQSMVRPERRHTASTMAGSASPPFLRWMSAAISSTESATPSARCSAVPQAGTKPEDSEVEPAGTARSEEHTSELQSLMRISYAVFCLKKKKEYKDIAPTPTITINLTETI